MLLIQELLQRLKDDSVRSDFVHQRNGACPVDKVEMEFLDKFAQQVVPTRPNFSNEPTFSSSAKASADHFSFLIDGRNRQFMDTGLTYEKARELFTRIQSCSYWDKDIKVVEVSEASRAENDTPMTDDLESKDEKSEEVAVSAPAPTQVPTPIFNGNVNMMPVQQQRLQHAGMARIQPQQQPPTLPAPSNVQLNMKTATAVENAYFNQMNYSQQQQHQQQQQQLMTNGMPPMAPTQNDYGANFSFLQESELDAPTAPGSQQKMPVNVIQSKHSPVQHQAMPPVQSNQPPFKSAANFHPQSPIAYPPGLKVQQQAPHIPVNYHANTQQQLNQQSAVPSQVPSHMIPKQQQPINGGNSIAGYGTPSQTPPNNNQAAPATRLAYPALVPTKAQYQQQMTNKNLTSAKPMESKPVMDGSGDALKANVQMPEKEDYQQQPQIDTWTNETAAQASGNFTSRPAGGFNRNRADRSSGGGGGKFSNYRWDKQFLFISSFSYQFFSLFRNSQSRNYNENGSGDSPRDGAAAAAAGTFFRNNERYNGSTPPAGNRFAENRGGGNFKPREGNYRAGSGRFAGSASASAQGSSNSGQRK